MENITRELTLANGLVMFFSSQSQRYFGDYYRVKLVIRATIPVLPEYFEEPGAFDQACALLGTEVKYRRELERMGIPSTEIDRTVTRLIDDFILNSGSYFSARDFPRKMVVAETGKVLKKTGRVPPSRFRS